MEDCLKQFRNKRAVAQSHPVSASDQDLTEILNKVEGMYALLKSGSATILETLVLCDPHFVFLARVRNCGRNCFRASMRLAGTAKDVMTVMTENLDSQALGGLLETCDQVRDSRNAKFMCSIMAKVVWATELETLTAKVDASRQSATQFQWEQSGGIRVSQIAGNFASMLSCIGSGILICLGVFVGGGVGIGITVLMDRGPPLSLGGRCS